MRKRTSGSGKPRWKRAAEPREIGASSAAPEPFEAVPEPVFRDDSDLVADWQSGRNANVGIIPAGGDWRRRRKKSNRKYDIPRTVLSDAQWRRVAPFLTGKRGDPGRTAKDNRRRLEGIL